MTYDRVALKQEIEAEEGFRSHVYDDSEGWKTIGIGRLVDEKKGGGITKEEAYFLLDNDIDRVEKQLDQYIAWWRTLSDTRQRALLNCSYQLGVGGLLKFSIALGYLQNSKYNLAADEFLNSRWAKQTPARAKRIADMIRYGETSKLSS